MSYRPGDAVWAHSDGANAAPGKHAGEVIGLRPAPGWYEVRIFDTPSGGEHGTWAIRDRYLSPRFNDGDSSARGNWDAVPWKPSVKEPEVAA